MKKMMGRAETHTEAARIVFADLCASSVSALGMSTWLGSSGGTIGSTVYSGTAGIAWALAEYARFSGDARAADMAKGAMSYAVRHAGQIPRAQRFGFYSGWAGIIFAAAWVGELLEDESIRFQGSELLARLSSEQCSAEFDIVSGTAGTVLALSSLGPVLGDGALELAYRAAMHLRSARCTPQHLSVTASWKPPGKRRALALTGLAHGAAGAGWALLELWAPRQNESWMKELAYAAFGYEDALFDIEKQNWPDLRHYPDWRATKLLPPPFQTAWCHGAGGIAISRARGFELTGDEGLAEMARRGALILRENSEQADAVERDFCLCHGTTGSAELLEILEERTGVAVPRALIDRIMNASADYLLERDEREGAAGLMLGKAGIAAALLRRSGATAISPLLPLMPDSRSV